jgi:hypothetical protein
MVEQPDEHGFSVHHRNGRDVCVSITTASSHSRQGLQWLQQDSVRILQSVASNVENVYCLAGAQSIGLRPCQLG